MNGLEIKNISISHADGFLAVSDFSLSLPLREAKILIGAIGGGKSSILRSVCGLLDYEGEIFFCGNDLKHISIRERNFVYASVGVPLFGSKTVEYNLAYGSKIRKLDKETTEKRLQEVCKLFDISDIVDCKVKKLDNFEKRKIIIARACMRDAELYLFNDVTRGLNESEAAYIISKIDNLYKERKATMLLATSDYSAVRNLGQSMILINGGKKICEGDAEFYRNYPKNTYASLFTENDIVD